MKGRRRILGPGMIEILQGIGETGSLRQSALKMEMSYMKAWLMVKQLNAAFAGPLITIARGGRQGGGAVLTPRGAEILKLYHEMELACQKAIAPAARKIGTHLRPTRSSGHKPA
jgi:molybdate transport system regulatory protein